MMNKQKIIAACIALLISLFITACDWDWKPGNSFAYELQGTWVSNAQNGVYSGALEITYDTITITGYEGNWISWVGDNNKRPFNDFPRGIAFDAYSEKLEGNSEKGEIFIKKAGAFQSGIPYTYEDLGPGREKLLYFNFGGREEVLKKESFEF